MPTPIQPECIYELRKLGFSYFIGAFGHLDEDGCAPLFHIVGYPEEPTKEDLNSLIEELRTDEEFGMTADVYRQDFVLVACDETFWANYKAPSAVELNEQHTARIHDLNERLFA